MKILHIGDVHLGVELHGRPDPAKGYNTRVGDFLACLDHALARVTEYDIVLFCGDIYHQCNPTPTLQREFATRLRAVSQLRPVVIIPGNHDLPNAWGRASSIDVFAALGLPNVHIYPLAGAHRLTTQAGDVVIAALPFASKARLCNQESMKGLTPEEIHFHLSSILADTVDYLGDACDRLDPEQQCPRVLMAHWTVEGASYGGFRAATLGHDVILPESALCDSRFDYVALAHLHQHQAPLPHAVYPGSIERVDFGEEHEEKGYVIADVTRGMYAWVFHPLPARRFVTLKLTADTLDSLLEQLAAADVDGAVVRVSYTLPPEVPSPADRDVRTRLLGASHVAGIKREQPPRELVARAASLVAGIGPPEALGMYLDSRPELAVQRKELERLGLELIASVGAKHDE